MSLRTRSSWRRKYNTGPVFKAPDGFPFTANSAIRRYFEPALVLLFPMIAGLTVMKDEIAVAVSRHSNFQKRPWSRLFGTVDAAVMLVFGGEEESLATARRIWELHGTVHGRRGTVRYSANDAELQVWVLACVFRGAEETSRRWATPLTHGERRALYADFRTFAAVFGIPKGLMPASLEAFDRYWKRIINGRTGRENYLLRTDASMRLARIIFQFNHPNLPRIVARAGRAITVASLDPKLQVRTHLTPSRDDQRLSKLFDQAMHLTYGRVPPALRRQAITLYLAVRRGIVSAKYRLASSHS